MSADGSGKFSFQPDTAAAVMSGGIKVRVDRLERLGPQFPAVGPLQLNAMFDGAFANNVASLNRLEIELATDAGRRAAPGRDGQSGDRLRRNQGDGECTRPETFAASG